MGYQAKFLKETERKNARWVWLILVMALVVGVAAVFLRKTDPGLPVVTEAAMTEPVEQTRAAVELPEYRLIENAVWTDIRNVQEAALMLEGEALLCVSGEQAAAIGALFAGAGNLGYEPQTYVMGTELLLIREDGMAVEVELDLLEDLCRLGDQFYDYGPGMDGEASVNGLEKLYSLLGLTEWTIENVMKWPQKVLTRYDYMLNDYLWEPKPINPEFRVTNFLPGRDTLVIHMADGREIDGADAYVDILRPLFFGTLEQAVESSAEEETVLYEMELVYAIGDMNRKAAYLGENRFFVSIEGDGSWSYRMLNSPELAEVVEALAG